MSDVPPLSADLIQLAATVLRESLDPRKTSHHDYQRLMRDLHWPLAVATWLDTQAAAITEFAGHVGGERLGDLTETDRAAIVVARAIVAVTK